MRVIVRWREATTSEIDLTPVDVASMETDGVDIESAPEIDAWLRKQPWFFEEIRDNWDSKDTPEIDSVEPLNDDGWLI